MPEGHENLVPGFQGVFTCVITAGRSTRASNRIDRAEYLKSIIDIDTPAPRIAVKAVSPASPPAAVLKNFASAQVSYAPGCGTLVGRERPKHGKSRGNGEWSELRRYD
jgi:hypothetical protein